MSLWLNFVSFALKMGRWSLLEKRVPRCENFQGREFNFHALGINFHALEFNFHALEIFFSSKKKILGWS